MTRVSVLLPVRDGAEHLGEALGSVLGQTYGDLELVVLDDASTDDTAEILAGVDDSRLHVLRSDRPLGLAPALQRLVAEAHGELLARMDADDVALPDRLERQVAFLDAHPDAAVVGGATIEIDDAGRELRRVAYPADPARDLLRRNTIAHPTVLMRRGAVEEVGGYRAVPVEDYDLWLRVAERHALANLLEPVLRYRRHGGQYSVTAIRRQALGALAARAAADARRAGRPDPLAAEPVVDDALLASIGVSRARIAEEVAAAQSTWARLLPEQEARRLLAAAAAEARGNPRAQLRVLAARVLRRL